MIRQRPQVARRLRLSFRDPVVTDELKGVAMTKTAIALLGMLVIGLAACNTIEGAGQDVKATGQAVEKAANQAKP